MDRVAQTMTLREGHADDVLCLSVLATQVFLETYATEGIRPDLAREALAVYSIERFGERLARHDTRFLLAERQGHLLGFAETVERGDAPRPELSAGIELVRLYVLRCAQRTGLGRQLLRQVEAFAIERRAPVLWLTAWVGNTNAIAFYLAQGWQDVGGTTYRIEGQDYANRIFAKTLAGPFADPLADPVAGPLADPVAHLSANDGA
jgi:diamine N-acetyltransferase